MIASLKSELRKIFSIRSTYIIMLFALALLGFFAFYTEGLRAGSVGSPAFNPDKLATLIREAVANLAFFGGLVAILSFTHEYRYNTIMYTLTSSRSRTKTLLAKLAAVSIFGVLFTLFVVVMAVALMYLGLAIDGQTLGPQTIPGDLWWRVLFMGWATCMIASLFASFIRQQVGTMAAYFLAPGPVEALAGLVLKENAIYLPFAVLQQVTASVENTRGLVDPLSPGRAALIFAIYLVVGWFIAWAVFLRRDAT